MKKTELLLFAIFSLALASCNNDPVSYTVSGLVIVENRCNMLADDLPVRVKVKYTLSGEKEKESVEQIIDMEPKDEISMQGTYSITITAKQKVTAYTAEVTRPNGKSICSMLPCPSAQKCSGEGTKSNIPLGESTAIRDTLTVKCECGF